MAYITWLNIVLKSHDILCSIDAIDTEGRISWMKVMQYKVRSGREK